MLKIMIGPMSWHFCSESCAQVWQERRHDPDAAEWFKVAKGVRAQLLNLLGDDEPRTDTITAADRSALECLDHTTAVALSVQEDHGLPLAPFSSDVAGDGADSAV